MKRKTSTVWALLGVCVCAGLLAGGCGKKADSKADQMEGGSGATQPSKGLPPGGESPSKPPTK